MYILVVDDDPLAVELVKFILRGAGYEADSVDNPRGALSMIENRLPNLLLLDVKMPGMDGFQFSEHLTRNDYHIPFIFLTGCAELEDRLRGFSLQAEDYICKPYHPQELLARVKVAGRHQGLQQPVQHLRAGSIELIPEEMRVIIGGQKTITLTPTEMQVLILLMNHAGHTVPREQFLRTIWQDHASNVVDVFIGHLRNKLGSAGKHIVCIRGVGYSLQVND